jgi:hypothetical protein
MGFEPMTFAMSTRRSNQLSYDPNKKIPLLFGSANIGGLLLKNKMIGAEDVFFYFLLENKRNPYI